MHLHRSLKRLPVSLALTIALLLQVAPARIVHAAGLIAQDLTSGLTPTDLANTLVGSGISVSNVTHQGAAVAAARFQGGTGIIGFESGVVLSSGCVNPQPGQTGKIAGPNESDAATCANGTPGDTQLSALVGAPTFDASILEFDFIPDKPTISVQYVFASEEYNEFVNSQFNDVFAFYVNGVNCAVLDDGKPVSINTINNGNPVGTLPNSHPELYRNNDRASGAPINTEMDGLTTVLTCNAAVTPNATNHMKLAIADTSDPVLDSNVFLAAGSFTTTPPDTTPPACALTASGTNPAGQSFIEVTVQDTGSGLGSVTVTQSDNAVTTVPPFSSGTTSPVVITATKIAQTLPSHVELSVQDVAGNTTTCDPITVTLQSVSGVVRPQVVRGVGNAEHLVTVQNGSPGMSSVEVHVNGHAYRIDQLHEGEQRTIDIGSALHKGNVNTFVFTARGERGARADLMIWDGHGLAAPTAPARAGSNATIRTTQRGGSITIPIERGGSMTTPIVPSNLPRPHPRQVGR